MSYLIYHNTPHMHRICVHNGLPTEQVACACHSPTYTAEVAPHFCSPLIEPLVVVGPAELFVPALRVRLLHAFGHHESPDHRLQSHFARILAVYALDTVFIRLLADVELFLLGRFVPLALLRRDLWNSCP